MADGKTKAKIMKLTFQSAVDKLKDLGIVDPDRTGKFVVNLNVGGVNNVEEVVNHR